MSSSRPGVASGYLIDTNVISELRRRQPEPRVVEWFERRPARVLYLSVLSLGQIRRGVERLVDGQRAQALRSWLEEDLPAWFHGRLLPIDTAVADQWGRLQAEAGRPLPAIDSLLAATALAHDLVLTTRNVRDLVGLPVVLVNPWEGDGDAPVG